MKALFRVLIAATLTTAASGCEKFLDINTNPNSATSVSPDALLASALTTTAANYTGGLTGRDNYNSYASFAAGYWGKSGVVSGFSQERQYTYNNTYYQTLFNNTYDNLNDYDIIQKQGAATYPNHAAIARIMKVYNYMLLVDQYGDVPYKQALKGLENTTPVYDKAADIYKDLVVQLKGAITDINAVKAGAFVVGNEDVVFNGVMLRWKQFANSLRLRILLRESSTGDAALNSYVATEMTALQAEPDGFIARDVVVQPTYTANTNQQNPFYDRYGFSPGASRTQPEYSYVMPTNYIIRQYERNSDQRISQLYRKGQVKLTDSTSVPAYVGTDLGEAQPPLFTAGSPDDKTVSTVGSRFLLPSTAVPLGGTFLRSATAPTVLMLLSEHLFSKAEAESRNLLAGGNMAAKQDFLDGIKSSFIMTFREGTTTPTTLTAATSASAPGVTQYTAYLAANATNGLVNYDVATTLVPDGTDASQAALTTPRTVSNVEKILYQKYLAENTVASIEALDDYRRTGLPKFKLSLQSGGRPLPKRLFYPQSETSTNANNIPVGVDQTTTIFWQK